MNEITPNSTSTTASARLNAATGATGRVRESPAAVETPSARDAVEISERARLLSRLQETPEVRQPLVDRVRAEIEAGTYLTPDKVAGAADNLADEIDLFG